MKRFLTILIVSAALLITGLALYNEYVPKKLNPPEVSLPSGLYTRERKIVLTKPKGASGATIYYTLDGTDPTVSSTAIVYTAPFIIRQDTTLRTYLRDENGNASDVVEYTYYIEIGRSEAQEEAVEEGTG